MKTFEQDLQLAINSSQLIHKSVLHQILGKNLNLKSDSTVFDLSLNPLVSLPSEGQVAYVTVFNSLTRTKDEIISFRIETSKNETICGIRDKDNVLVKHQVSPYFDRSAAPFVLYNHVSQVI